MTVGKQKGARKLSLMGFNAAGPEIYPLVICYKKLLKMAIEIVSFPIKNGEFP